MSAPPKTRQKSRSYELPCRANLGKQQAVADLLPWWQRGLVHVQLVQSRRMRQGERLGFIDTKELPGYLSQRQWKSVVNQVNAALRSWQELMVAAVRPLITEMDFAVEARIDLYRANKAHRWWDSPILEPLVVQLMRTQLPLPNLSRCRTMCLDGSVATHETPVFASQFPLWVRVSLRPGHRPVRLPFATSAFEQSAAGTRSNYLQIHVPEIGPVRYRVVKSSPVAPSREEGVDLGVDWGLDALLSTNDGRRFGTQLFGWLRERDVELTTLGASLQRQGIRPRSCKRYRNLSSRITSYITNEVGRVLNKVTDEQVRSLVVESLDFRSPALSAPMNRILSRAGRSTWKRKLASLEQDKGIAVIEINAAHTSRECSGCGYADSGNRTARARFHCRFCGLRLHADINAARVVLSRRSGKCASVRMSRRVVLTHLDQAFAARWGIDAGRVRERHPSPRSRATREPSSLGTG